MKTRNIISVCLLTVYSIVMAHSIIPHHHHSDFSQLHQHCEFEKPDDHNCCNHDSDENHTQAVSTNCCLADHQHNSHSHVFCSFEGKVILTKNLNLSNLFLPSTEIEFQEIQQNKPTFADTYVFPKILDPYCRDVHLRGPPQFS